jgi:hypothetical protein
MSDVTTVDAHQLSGNIADRWKSTIGWGHHDFRTDLNFEARSHATSQT